MSLFVLEQLERLYGASGYFDKKLLGAKLPKHKKHVHNIYPSRGVKPQGRNELCLCGSGKKFKKCCIDQEV